MPRAARIGDRDENRHAPQTARTRREHLSSRFSAKGNFPTEPAGDGAWIVKNSWGSKDGDAGSLSHWGIDGTGYFYLSYYDMSVASLYSVTAADADPGTIIQQHDWVGVTESFLVSPMSTTEASAANVFTAEQDIPIERGISQDYSASIGYTLYMDVVVNEGESLCFADGGWFDASEFNDDPNMTEDGMVTYGNFAIKVFGTPAQLQDAGSLSIVHTNDIHGRYATAGADAAVNGFAAVSALAQDCGADLILDAGDTFHGSTFSTVNQGEAVAALMDAAGYDATTPGNHDWSYGSARLAQIDRDHDFAVLAANVEDEAAGAPLFEQGYLLREVALEDGEGNLTGESVTVGVFGVIDEDLRASIAPDNVEGVAFAESVKAANTAAERLRSEGAEVVVALTHNEGPLAFASATRGIGVVIAGHGHVRIDETVTGADLARTGADLAFENAGGIRGGIPAGDVTMGDILAVSPYGNALATYELTGSQIADTLERSLALSADCRDLPAKQMEAVQAGEDPMQYSWPDSSGSVLQVGGAVMEVDWSKPDGQRIRSITVGGAPLDPDRTYSVTMNSYVASATGLYPALEGARLLGEYGTCTEALIGLVGQADWEATAARLSGTVTYVTDGSSSNQGDGSGGSGHLAATGDTAAGVAALASLSALAALSALATFATFARAPRTRMDRTRKG